MFCAGWIKKILKKNNIKLTKIYLKKGKKKTMLNNKNKNK